MIWKNTCLLPDILDIADALAHCTGQLTVMRHSLRLAAYCRSSLFPALSTCLLVSSLFPAMSTSLLVSSLFLLFQPADWRSSLFAAVPNCLLSSSLFPALSTCLLSIQPVSCFVYLLTGIQPVSCYAYLLTGIQRVSCYASLLTGGPVSALLCLPAYWRSSLFPAMPTYLLAMSPVCCCADSICLQPVKSALFSAVPT
jgi:hypothetical protein